MNFALWYLKQRGLAVNDDKSSLQITVEGMDFLEGNQPAPEAVLPLIKSTAPGDPKIAAPVPRSVGAVRSAMAQLSPRRS
jgi:hypothetical protein